MFPEQHFMGIIPARYHSTRFPGKPLASIMGKPMFQHVYQRAVQCRLLSRVVLATDHEKIFCAAEDLNIPVIMTSPSHRSGTDRVLEAARMINAPDHSVIVNIQGDEPALDPEMLDQLLTPFVSHPQVSITTLARPITREEADNPNVVKVVFSGTGRALYFSRSIIPYPREPAVFYGHIGLYAFRMKCLEAFGSLEQGRLEKIEKLEQLRMLEAEVPIHIVVTDLVSHGVDVPQDMESVIKIMQEKNNEGNAGP